MLRGFPNNLKGSGKFTISISVRILEQALSWAAVVEHAVLSHVPAAQEAVQSEQVVPFAR